MACHPDSHRTTDVKPDTLWGVETGNSRTNRKDDIFMQRRLVQNFTFILEWGKGTFSLTKHTQCWAYSRYFFPACCLLAYSALRHFLYLNPLSHFIWYQILRGKIAETTIFITEERDCRKTSKVLHSLPVWKYEFFRRQNQRICGFILRPTYFYPKHFL